MTLVAPVYGTIHPDLIQGGAADDVIYGGAGPRGDGMASLGISLASGSNALRSAVGVYDIGADGSISNVRIVLSEAGPAKSDPGVGTAQFDVPEGTRLGFFVLPHAMAFKTADLLTESGALLEFRTADGMPATATSAGPLTLWSVDAAGAATMIKTSTAVASLHSAADPANGADLNGDARQGALGAVNADGSITLGLNEGRSKPDDFSQIVLTITSSGLVDIAEPRLAAALRALAAIDNDTIMGGDGNDAIHGLEGDDYLIGDEGKDSLYGGSGDDMLRGDIGRDLLDGGEGNDTVFGGLGNDRLLGRAGDDQLVGGSGDDWLDGGIGNDALFGGNSADTLSGDKGDDTLVGGDGDDRLDGGSGNDQLFGGSAHDVLTGGSGADQLVGGMGNDLLFGGSDADALFGDDGDDSIEGGSGNDWIEGGSGNDSIRAGSDDDTVQGQNGNDLIFGGMGNDLLSGGDGIDVIWGDSGNDTIYGDAGYDTLNGGEGDDLVSGGGGFDRVHGGRGNDTLHGDEGNDRLDGSHDDDMLYGGTGSDTLIGGEGSDVLTGGQGADTFVWRTQDIDAWSDTVADFEAGYDRIDLTNLLLLTKGWTADSFRTDAMTQNGDAVDIAIGDLMISVQGDTPLSVVDVWGSILFA